MKYAAFLRGINVGGNTPIKMDELRRAFAALGFHGVTTTLLNSGNVVFEAAETDVATLTLAVERQLEVTFGRKTDIILRTAEEIQAIVDLNPFQDVSITPATRLYVTFLGTREAAGQESRLKVPYESPERDVCILRIADGAIYSALTLSPQRGTVDLMQLIEQAFGKNVTIRNWNTIIKVQQRLR